MGKELSASKVSQYLDIGVSTLTNWYRWYNGDYEKPKDVPPLPTYVMKGVSRIWKEEDLPMLEAFKAWIPRGKRGVMGSYSATQWGKRGKRILEKKRLKKQ